MRKSTFYLILIALTSILIFPTATRFKSTFNETIILNIREPRYKVVFNNASNGKGVMEDQEFTYGTKDNLNENLFTNYGYNFVSWNTKSDGSGTTYQDEAEVNNLTTEENGTFNLYAIYENIINMRITDLSVLNTNNASSSNESFDFEELKSTVTLNSQNSYVDYTIDITNYLNKNMGILSITGLPDNLEYEVVSNYDMKTKLCNASSDNSGNKNTITLRIKYKDGGYNSGSTSYNLDLDFEYRQVFNITYKNIPNGTDLNSQNLVLDNTDNGPTGNYPLDVVNIKYPKEIMVDDTVKFDFYPYIPTTLSVSDTVTSNYTKPFIKLSNVTGDVTIKSTTMGEWVMFDHPESVTFDGNNLINTQLQLLSEANHDKDLRITFEVGNNNPNLTEHGTIFNMLDESGNPWPGYLVRQENNNIYSFESNGGAASAKDNFSANDINKVEILKLDNILYYRINDGYYVWFADFTNYNYLFNTPATFGGSINGSGNEYRYFEGTISNMEIRYLDSDINPKTYLPMYAVYSYVAEYNFNGSNNLNTGVSLFTEENYDKDFVISVDVDAVGNGNATQATIINSFYENIINLDGKDRPYPGFAFRIDDNDTSKYYITANNNEHDLSESIETLNIHTFKFIRENKVLYYQINDGEKVELYDFGDPNSLYYNVYFDTPITFGSSLTSNNDIQRQFRGTLSNMYILLEMDGSGVTPTGPGTGGEDPGTGGEDPGTGGEDPGTGGEDPGTGGEDPGTGGEDPGTGGEDPSSNPVTVVAALSNSWQNGGVTSYQYTSVKVTNTSSSSISSWSITVTLPEGAEVQSHDSSVLTVNGNEFTFTNETWNGTLAPDGSTTFGMIITSPTPLSDLTFR